MQAGRPCGSPARPAVRDARVRRALGWPTPTGRAGSSRMSVGLMAGSCLRVLRVRREAPRVIQALPQDRPEFSAFESHGVRGHEFVGTGTYGGLSYWWPQRATHVVGLRDVQPHRRSDGRSQPQVGVPVEVGTASERGRTEVDCTDAHREWRRRNEPARLSTPLCDHGRLVAIRLWGD